MRRTASEVLRSLEMRVARLEGRTANSYLQQISNELIAKDDIVDDTIADKYDEVGDGIEEYTPESGFTYGAWFITSKNHGAFEHWAQSANVASYLVYDRGTWKADIVWTGSDLGRGRKSPEEWAEIQVAESYFDNINSSPLKYKATGDVATDLRGIRSLLSKI